MGRPGAAHFSDFHNFLILDETWLDPVLFGIGKVQQIQPARQDPDHTLGSSHQPQRLISATRERSSWELVFSRRVMAS